MLFRAVTITAIIGLGVVGAYLFLPKTSVDQSVLSSGTTLIEQRIIGATPHVENVTGSPSAFTQSASETLAPNNLSSNLTDQFIEKIKADLIAKNANGPQSIGNDLGLLGTEPDDIAAQSLIEAGRLFDPSVLRPTINNSKLTITQDNNASAFTEYLIAFTRHKSQYLQSIAILRTRSAFFGVRCGANRDRRSGIPRTFGKNQ